MAERTKCGADVVSSASANTLSYFFVVDFDAGYYVLLRALDGTMGSGIRDTT